MSQGAGIPRRIVSGNPHLCGSAFALIRLRFSTATLPFPYSPNPMDAADSAA